MTLQIVWIVGCNSFIDGRTLQINFFWNIDFYRKTYAMPISIHLQAQLKTICILKKTSKNPECINRQKWKFKHIQRYAYQQFYLYSASAAHYEKKFWTTLKMIKERFNSKRKRVIFLFKTNIVWMKMAKRDRNDTVQINNNSLAIEWKKAISLIF